MSRLVALCFDAADPPGLARFWAEALGWEVGDEAGGAVALRPTDGTRFTLRFGPGSEPKTAKNRIHLDLTTTSLDDQRDSAERFVARGARPIDVGQREDEGHIVLADPEGNELCLIEPGNRFLAGTGRLGSITCDGTPAAGCFWSAVLGWPLVWDQDEETAIRAPDGTGPLITWGPPVPPPPPRSRLHLDIAAPAAVGLEAEVDRLVSLGARRVDTGRAGGDRVLMTDPDDNELCVLGPGSRVQGRASTGGPGQVRG